MDHDRPGVHGLRSGADGPEDRVAQRAGGVALAVRDEAPSGVESAICGEAPGALTLDDLIAGAWEGLCVGEVVCCPACGGRMSASDGGAASGGAGTASRVMAPDDTRHGDCLDCGARLC